MQLLSSDCNERYAWVGDIYCPPMPHDEYLDELLNEVAQVEEDARDIVIDVYSDRSLVETPENLKRWAIIRFLRYSQISINIVPIPKDMVPKPLVRKRTAGVRPQRIARILDPEDEEDDFTEPREPEED